MTVSYSSPFNSRHDIFLYVATFSVLLGMLYIIFQRTRVINCWREIFGSKCKISSRVKSDLLDESKNEFSKFHARILLVICAAMYGSNFVGTKYIQRTLAPSLTTTLRFLIGSIGFLPYVLSYKGDLKVIYCSAEIGMWGAIGFNTQAVTLQFTTASKNAFITALCVVIIPILDIIHDVWRTNSIVVNKSDDQLELLTPKDGDLEVAEVALKENTNLSSCSKKLSILFPALMALVGVGMLNDHSTHVYLH